MESIKKVLHYGQIKLGLEDYFSGNWDVALSISIKKYPVQFFNVFYGNHAPQFNATIPVIPYFFFQFNTVCDTKHPFSH